MMKFRHSDKKIEVSNLVKSYLQHYNPALRDPEGYVRMAGGEYHLTEDGLYYFDDKHFSSDPFELPELYFKGRRSFFYNKFEGTEEEYSQFIKFLLEECKYIYSDYTEFLKNLSDKEHLDDIVGLTINWYREILDSYGQLNKNFTK